MRTTRLALPALLTLALGAQQAQAQNCGQDISADCIAAGILQCPNRPGHVIIDGAFDGATSRSPDFLDVHEIQCAIDCLDGCPNQEHDPAPSPACGGRMPVAPIQGGTIELVPGLTYRLEPQFGSGRSRTLLLPLAVTGPLLIDGNGAVLRHRNWMNDGTPSGMPALARLLPRPNGLVPNEADAALAARHARDWRIEGLTIVREAMTLDSEVGGIRLEAVQAPTIANCSFIGVTTAIQLVGCSSPLVRACEMINTRAPVVTLAASPSCSEWDWAPCGGQCIPAAFCFGSISPEERELLADGTARLEANVLMPRPLLEGALVQGCGLASLTSHLDSFESTVFEGAIATRHPDAAASASLVVRQPRLEYYGYVSSSMFAKGEHGQLVVEQASATASNLMRLTEVGRGADVSVHVNGWEGSVWPASLAWMSNDVPTTDFLFTGVGNTAYNTTQFELNECERWTDPAAWPPADTRPPSGFARVPPPALALLGTSSSVIPARTGRVSDVPGAFWTRQHHCDLTPEPFGTGPTRLEFCCDTSGTPQQVLPQ